MNFIRIPYILLLISLFSGCAAHQSYNTSQFRDRSVNTEKIALNKDGLSLEQIKLISSTKPPKKFPVDIAVILVTDGYISSEVKNTITYNMVSELKKYNKIKRITIIPKFLLPNQLGFNTIQELGVRSLSEYTLVLHINSSDVFNWTKLINSQYEVHSDIDYILVDSYTSAMLTSDKLFSKQIYETNLFEIKERRKAQKQLFAEQGNLLANNIKSLFSSAQK